MCVSVQMQWLRNECTEVQVLKKVYLSVLKYKYQVLDRKPGQVIVKLGGHTNSP